MTGPLCGRPIPEAWPNHAHPVMFRRIGPHIRFARITEDAPRAESEISASPLQRRTQRRACRSRKSRAEDGEGAGAVCQTQRRMQALGSTAVQRETAPVFTDAPRSPYPHGSSVRTPLLTVRSAPSRRRPCRLRRPHSRAVSPASSVRTRTRRLAPTIHRRRRGNRGVSSSRRLLRTESPS